MGDPSAGNTGNVDGDEGNKLSRPGKLNNDQSKEVFYTMLTSSLMRMQVNFTYCIASKLSNELRKKYIR